MKLLHEKNVEKNSVDILEDFLWKIGKILNTSPIILQILSLLQISSKSEHLWKNLFHSKVFQRKISKISRHLSSIFVKPCQWCITSSHVIFYFERFCFMNFSISAPSESFDFFKIQKCQKWFFLVEHWCLIRFSQFKNNRRDLNCRCSRSDVNIVRKGISVGIVCITDIK